MVEPHNHPLYEETFKRIATILDVFAEDHEKLQRSQEELQRSQAEFQRSQAEFQRSQAELQRSQVELHRSQVELQHLVDSIGKKLDKHIEKAAERDAETTDKLNALIDLMARHIGEQH